MKAKSLAVVLFAAVGTFALVQGISAGHRAVADLVILLSQRPNVYVLEQRELISIIARLVVPIALVLMGLKLMLRPPVGILSRHDISQDETLPQTWPPQAVLRAGVMLIGILFLAKVPMHLGVGYSR